MKLIAKLAAAAAICLAALATLSCKEESKDKPVILLRSGWQVENIGDVAHTPGFLALAEKYMPQAEVIWWPFYGLLPEGEVEMLMKRFPNLKIVRGYLNDDGTPSSQELGDAIMKADIFIHNSGPSMLSWKEAHLFKEMTGKPFGVYGVTYGLYGTPEKATLSEADFLYFRDTVSLENARRDGVTCPVLEWAPDAAFGAEIENGEKAEAILKEYGLEEGKFICCNPNQRRTPFWEHTFKGRSFDQSVEDLNQSMRDHDHNPMIEAVTRIARETDLKIFIVHEDITELQIGKEWILDKLPEDVKAKTVWLDRDWSLDEAIGVYKRSAGLFSHEMHCPIMCIANGIPAIVVRWKEQSTKGYMWETIGLPEWLFDFDNGADVARYVDTVVEFAKNPGQSKEKALKAQKFVNDRQKETFDVIRKTINK